MTEGPVIEYDTYNFIKTSAIAGADGQVVFTDAIEMEKILVAKDWREHVLVHSSGHGFLSKGYSKHVFLVS